MAPQAPLMLPVHLISELDQMALTLVDAFMNCVKIEWDATHYVERLLKKFPRPGTAAADASEAIMRRQYPLWNESAANVPISGPCIVVDMQGVILAWHLPGILNGSWQSEMMAVTKKLHPLLEQCPKGTSWHLDPGYFPSGLEGLQGIVDLLPAWFQQGHELISIKMVQKFPQVRCYRNCNLKLLGLGLLLEYGPGSVVGVLAALLEHEVEHFEGERVCYVYFMRDRVHEWAKVPGKSWMPVDHYTIA
ncbi:hypothetical protein EDB87DRAFT_1574743 [Lactarius vividus]|nr:hypothetical protein EDB87DRAFT_1574743 [Lactarius vividus]